MKELTSVQQEFLKILECFMHDKTYKLPEKFKEIVEVFRMAQEHQMTAAVYEQIRQDSFWKEKDVQELYMTWKRATIREVMLQVQRTEGFLSVYEIICKKGVSPLIIKGLVCRNMYGKPDYRISGDEDILIHRDDFQLCDEILLQEGFQRDEVNMENIPHEVSYINPRNGVYIELHCTLFPEESGAYGHLNDEFWQVFEHSICQEIHGKKIWTLSPTEHLFYLICHSFKHFLHSGFGVRQVCDMVLMAEQYGTQIDWRDIQERLVRLNMKLYWDALVKIGTEYFDFSLDKACYPADMFYSDVDCHALLQDLLDGGIYGDSSMERKHSSNMTLAAVAGGKKNSVTSLCASLFPKWRYMKEKFVWLKKYPWLLPVAYVIRIVRYLKTTEHKKQGEQNSVQIGIGRVELLKQYHIIE